MDKPLVSVIMPIHDRGDSNYLLHLALSYYMLQDYPNKELILVIDGDTEFITSIYENAAYTDVKIIFCDPISIGLKRNKAIQNANGEIIIHFDSDDHYKPDWITKSVDYLQKTGADITGLSQCYFYEPNKNLYLYNHDITPFRNPYVAGATMCYKKEFWGKHPFQDRRTGEDQGYCLETKKVSPHDYINGFVAILHGSNTSSHLATNTVEFSKLPIEKIRDIMGSDLEKYAEM